MQCIEESVRHAVYIKKYFKHFPSQVLFARVCGKIEIFFLLAFEKGKFVLVCGHQGKLDKCTKNTSMVLANKRRPWREINV